MVRLAMAMAAIPKLEKDCARSQLGAQLDNLATEQIARLVLATGQITWLVLAKPKTANKNGGSCQAMYSEIYSSSRFHKFIQAQADLFTIWQPLAVQSSSAHLNVQAGLALHGTSQHIVLIWDEKDSASSLQEHASSNTTANLADTSTEYQ